MLFVVFGYIIESIEETAILSMLCIGIQQVVCSLVMVI